VTQRTSRRSPYTKPAGKQRGIAEVTQSQKKRKLISPMRAGMLEVKISSGSVDSRFGTQSGLKSRARGRMDRQKSRSSDYLLPNRARRSDPEAG